MKDLPGRYIFWVLFAGVVFLCGFGSPIPKWFYKVPTGDGCIYSVGISNRYSGDKDSFTAARDDGVENLIRSIRVHVRSGLAEYVENGSIEMRTFISEEIDSTLYNTVYQQCMILDSILTDKQAIVLVGWNKNRTKGEYGRLSRLNFKLYSRPSSEPSWIRSTPRRNGYLFGVGMSTSYGELARSWNESAKKARLEVAQQININVSNLDISYTGLGDHNKSWTEQTVNITLEGARVTERWYDAKQDIYYTLVEYMLTK